MALEFKTNMRKKSLSYFSVCIQKKNIRVQVLAWQYVKKLLKNMEERYGWNQNLVKDLPFISRLRTL